MNRKITITGANITFLVFTGAITLFQIIIAILLGIKVFTNYIYLTLLINEVVFILLPVLIYAFIKRVDFRETFRIRKPGLVPVIFIILISIPAYAVAILLNNFVIYLLQFIGKIPSQTLPIPQNLQQLLISLFFVAVVPGICEEIFHRGLILKAYEKRGTIKALVISSIFFGIFHFDITNLLGPIFLGLLIGFYVIRTNSIFAGILAHFLNNAIAMSTQYFFGGRTAPEYVTISFGELGQVALLGLAGLIVTALLVAAFKKATAGKYVMVPSISSVKKDIAAVVSHWPIILILGVYLLMMVAYVGSIILIKISG